jgi:hypothetical protein
MAAMVELKPCSLDAPKNAKGFFQSGYLESQHPVLVFELVGKATNDPEFEDIYDYAPAWIIAGLEAWQPGALVLDFRRLEYVYGDRMTNVVGAPTGWYAMARPERDLGYLISCGRSAPETFPVAIVVSDLCRAGITSLLTEMMSLDPADLLFDSLESAFAALEKKLQGWEPF